MMYVYGCPLCGAFELLTGDEHREFGDYATCCPDCLDGPWLCFGFIEAEPRSRPWWTEPRRRLWSRD
jgi:hypothetical protein